MQRRGGCKNPSFRNLGVNSAGLISDRMNRRLIAFGFEIERSNQKRAENRESVKVG